MSLFRELIKSVKAFLLMGRRFERTVDEVVLLGHRVDRAGDADARRSISQMAILEAMSTELRRVGQKQESVNEACDRMCAALDSVARPLGELAARQGQLLTSVEAMATELRYSGPRHQMLMDAVQKDAEMIRQMMAALIAIREVPAEIVRHLRDGSERLQALAREARELSSGFRNDADRRAGHSEVRRAMEVGAAGADSTAAVRT